ncbi:MAG: pyrroline-5-carboxylate reductase [Victivallaceae bacterium]|nr:pyrroline-5-carboxylate reductase [Victivallaceae bacterium]
MDDKILFIGAGKMATAIAGGMTMRNPEDRMHIVAFDPNPKAASAFAAATGCPVFSDDVKPLVTGAATILVAVKPQYLKVALSPVFGLADDKLVISIVAGAELASLVELTGSNRVVRVMPNTPALVGEGVSVYAAAGELAKADAATVESVLGAVGKAFRGEERWLNAVTGLSGSGPAYVLEFIMALADGGVREGLPRDLALELAIRTVIGSAKLAAESGLHPAVLRDQVISPGGTTAAGVAELDRSAFRSAVAEAVVAASRRSAELGKR